MKKNNVGFNFDGNKVIAAFLLVVIVVEKLPLWCLVLVMLQFFDFKFKGWPYFTIGHESGRGLYIDKGRYK